MLVALVTAAAALAAIAIGLRIGLPPLLRSLGLHAPYRGPRFALPGGRALIVTTSHATPGPKGRPTGVFASERLTGALLDRLTHHVHILEMNGDSYRLKQSKRRQRGARATDIPDSSPEE